MIEGMIPVEEAQKIILERVHTIDHELVAIEEAFGRVLAEDVCTDIDLSPFDDTAMDGYALRCADLEGATESTPVTLQVVGHIGAGSVFEGTVEPGHAVRIMTGAPIPAGADGVVQIEKASWTGDGGPSQTVSFVAPAPLGANIRKAGEEAHAGDVVLAAGTCLSGPALGLLASAGHTHVSVYRQPKVGVISLGSELVDPAADLAPGQIRNSNSYALAGEVAAAHCVACIYPIAIDDYEITREAVEQAIAENDFVVTSGGASGGDYDYISQVAASLGEVEFTLVQMKPGKSQTFAIIKGTPLLGLAGNPTAAVVGFEMLARPALLKMQGFAHLFRSKVTAFAGHDMKKKGSRRFYLRGRITHNDEGQLVAFVEGNQSSALLGPIASATCLITLPEDSTGIASGQPVECVRIDLPEGSVL